MDPGVGNEEALLNASPPGIFLNLLLVLTKQSFYMKLKTLRPVVKHVTEIRMHGPSTNAPIQMQLLQS